jgi:hypothetical protein
MKRVVLFQGNTTEAEAGLSRLKKARYTVERRVAGPQVLREIREDPPTAVIIGLERAPYQGRDIGIYLRHYKATRKIQIVYVGGAPEKVAKIKEHIGDAVFTEWDGIDIVLKRVIKRAPVKPSVPKSLFVAYTGTPLVKKLGIKANAAVVLINPPSDFAKTLAELPEGVIMRSRLQKNNDLIIWFVRSQKDIKDRIEKMVAATGKGGLWIAWPKRNSAMSSDLTQKIVRAIGLGAGLIDYKVCAIDKTWAGLKFTRRG